MVEIVIIKVMGVKVDTPLSPSLTWGLTPETKQKISENYEINF